ncbi:hypothetical protein HOG98_03665 [bacterium]|jgi:hypothetical protein|nr:hypothetical protein [bacterium]
MMNKFCKSGVFLIFVSSLFLVFSCGKLRNNGSVSGSYENNSSELSSSGEVSSLIAQSIMTPGVINTDSSGKIEILIIEGESSSDAHPSLVLTTPSDEWIMIGAGGHVKASEPGSLLYTTYPQDEGLQSWVIQAKDHIRSSPGIIHGYAILMKVQGISKNELLKHMIVKQKTSTVTSLPETTLALNSDYIVIGGGYRVNWEWDGSNAGNHIVDSYPVGNGWRVQSKDHLWPDAVSITGYVIGIEKEISGLGTFINDINKATSGIAGWPKEQVGTDSGFVLVGGGADAHRYLPSGYGSYNGYGSMLIRNYPDPSGYWVAQARDHINPDPSSLIVYSVGLKLLSQ